MKSLSLILQTFLAPHSIYEITQIRWFEFLGKKELYMYHTITHNGYAILKKDSWQYVANICSVFEIYKVHFIDSNHYHLLTISMYLTLSEYFGLSFPPHKSLEEAKIIFGSDAGKQTVRKLKELPQCYCRTSKHLLLYFTASAIVHLGFRRVIYSYSLIWLPAFSKETFPKVSSTKK